MTREELEEIKIDLETDYGGLADDCIRLVAALEQAWAENEGLVARSDQLAEIAKGFLAEKQDLAEKALELLEIMKKAGIIK